ncbi:MAG: response regulator transcription factor [Planctomycetaceae bacterium]|nr:response regulator transcription factor [Planctomycetaceae bacterium]
MMDRKPIVYVVDDDHEVREALRLTLEMMDYDVVVSATGPEFLDRFRPEFVSCLIADLRMAGMSGLELLEAMADRDIRLPTIMISGHGDVPAAVQAMKGGVIDFLEKPYRIDALRDSVRRGIELHRASQQEESRQQLLRHRFERLTPAEREVLELTVTGLPDKAIAARLEVSLRTVQLRRASLLKKLEVESRIELVRVAQQLAPSTID